MNAVAKRKVVRSIITRPLQRMVPKIGRNDPCPCRSGRKFKKCCMLLPAGHLERLAAHAARVVSR